MIECADFYRSLLQNEIDFFCGVPDSLLKSLCAYIADNAGAGRNIITANEGGAIALATGYYLATKRIALVYMQNSGLGNSVNPLVSLADPQVYSIPLLLLIGWRGEPGEKDEPQHIKQGMITLALLKTLDIPFEIVPKSADEARQCVTKVCKVMREKEAPYALIVRRDTFGIHRLQTMSETPYELSREEVIRAIVEQLGPDDLVVSTTGYASRELFECREHFHEGHNKDFLVVGSMGLASQIALGIALQKPGKQIYCIDGDGAAIMHMGSLATIGSERPANFKHIIINNGAHDSVGGQPTAGFAIDFVTIAKACGYKVALNVQTRDETKEMINQLRQTKGPALLEIRVRKGARGDLGRPTTTPIENKSAFMEFLEG